MKKIKLYCIPYAGGSSAIYTRWSKHLDSSIELFPIELAGRAKRSSESFCNNMKEVVEDISDYIIAHNQGSDFAIFGHSMGSIITYEVLKKLSRVNHKQPMHAFFSGRYPPNVKKEIRNLHLLTDEELEKEALDLGGIPEDLFRFKGLLKNAINTLRADYKVLESYKGSESIHMCDCDITALAGIDDTLATPEDMLEWKKYSKKNCSIHYFDGGHFYLNRCADKVVAIINDKLSGCGLEEAYG